MRGGGSPRTSRSPGLVALVTVGFLIASHTAAGAGGGSSDASRAPRVIIDTDLSRWWDDASTIGMANVLHEQGRIRLLGVVSNVQNPAAVAAIDAINTGYGNPDIPIGAVVRTGTDAFEHGYTDEVVRRLPNSVDDHTDVPAAAALYRRLLARAPDDSVTIVSLGGYTNLADLLASERGQGSRLDGRALVDAKVRRLVQMDGLFPGGGPAFTNQKIDLDAASEVVNGDWPTPIAWVDGLGGIATRVGGTLCTEVGARHPMRVVYEILFQCGPPGDGNWDAPTLLYAIGDSAAVFEELGHGGAAVINEQGGLSWQTPSPRPDDVYVHVVDQDALNQRIDELLVLR
jgi:hypothetical protein